MNGDRDDSVVRHEEELVVGAEAEQLGAVRARKLVEAFDHDERVPREIEDADVERVAADEGDSGQIETLPDGSVSIPLLEEEIVVSKRTVVRERVVIRKRTRTEEHRVRAELRREHLDVEVDEPPAA
jgi:uncharacterized protein (TIGR02271 family)